MSQSEEDVVLRFSVRDTGIGIPVEKQPLLFDSFTQVDTSTTRKYGGTGLGLAISKQLAQLMGGTIGVSSEPGVGSEFWFTARCARQPGRESVESPPAELNGARILIADDNASCRAVIARALGACGAVSEEAATTAVALESLRRAQEAGNPFRAALLDLQMHHGIAMLRDIRAEARFRETHLVLMSEVGAQSTARETDALDPVLRLTKPIRVSALVAGLAGLLGGRRESPAAEGSTGPCPDCRPPNRARILVAEDNVVNQKVALSILGRIGLRADVAANGIEAIRALENVPYDLVLMDVQMPEMDGLEATRRIREADTTTRLPRVPIIAMTAHAMQGDRERCLEAGMDDYLTKPVTPRRLIDMVMRWLPSEDRNSDPSASASEAQAA